MDKVNYDPFKVGLAIDIIDKLYIKLKPFLCDNEIEENKYEIEHLGNIGLYTYILKTGICCTLEISMMSLC